MAGSSDLHTNIMEHRLPGSSFRVKVGVSYNSQVVLGRLTAINIRVNEESKDHR